MSTQWTHMKDRLPDVNQLVLIYDDDGSEYTVAWRSQAEPFISTDASIDVWLIRDDNYYHSLDTFADCIWMPIPPLPPNEKESK